MENRNKCRSTKIASCNQNPLHKRKHKTIPCIFTVSSKYYGRPCRRSRGCIFICISFAKCFNNKLQPLSGRNIATECLFNGSIINRKSSCHQSSCNRFKTEPADRGAFFIKGTWIDFVCYSMGEINLITTTTGQNLHLSKP